MEPREETRLGSSLVCDAFKMSTAGCVSDENGRSRGDMSSLHQQVRRRFMITDILSSAAAAAAVDNGGGGTAIDDDTDRRQDDKPLVATALDMRLLFPHLPLGSLTSSAERADMETDTDNEGEDEGETDHEKGD